MGILDGQAKALTRNIVNTNEATHHPDKSKLIEEKLDAWKKMPKEQALKEALQLYNSRELDVGEVRVKLEVLKFMSELQGALARVQTQKPHVVAIQVNVRNELPQDKIINIQ